MIFSVSSELYPKLVVLKAAYQFTDTAYVLVDYSDGKYIIDIKAKSGNPNEEFDFENELLFQALRDEINTNTKEIRTIIAARALASTVINTPQQPNENYEPKQDGILDNWFDNENSKV